LLAPLLQCEALNRCRLTQKRQFIIFKFRREKDLNLGGVGVAEEAAHVQVAEDRVE